jgi:hypothetical protein
VGRLCIRRPSRSQIDRSAGTVESPSVDRRSIANSSDILKGRKSARELGANSGPAGFSGWRYSDTDGVSDADADAGFSGDASDSDAGDSDASAPRSDER